MVAAAQRRAAGGGSRKPCIKEAMLGINCIAQQEGQSLCLGHSTSTTLSPPQWGWRHNGGAEACGWTGKYWGLWLLVVLYLGSFAFVVVQEAGVTLKHFPDEETEAQRL